MFYLIQDAKINNLVSYKKHILNILIKDSNISFNKSKISILMLSHLIKLLSNSLTT